MPWTLTRLRTRLPAMLIQANESNLARTFDQRGLDAALPKVAGWAEALQAQAHHRSTETFQRTACHACSALACLWSLVSHETSGA